MDPVCSKRQISYGFMVSILVLAGLMVFGFFEDPPLKFPASHDLVVEETCSRYHVLAMNEGGYCYHYHGLVDETFDACQVRSYDQTGSLILHHN